MLNSFKKKKPEELVKPVFLFLLIIFIMMVLFHVIFNHHYEKYGKNYFDYKNNGANYLLTNQNPFNKFYWLSQYRKNHNSNELKKIINNSKDDFFRNYSIILLSNELIKKKKYSEAEKYLNELDDENFLTFKYYFLGFANQLQNNDKKAIDYYQVALKFDDKNDFMKDLIQLKLKFLED